MVIKGRGPRDAASIHWSRPRPVSIGQRGRLPALISQSPCRCRFSITLGYLMAFAAQAALLRQSREGGSWHVRVSLAQTGHWLRSLGVFRTGWRSRCQL